MSYRYSSADISVLSDISTLAKRCGLRPSDACAWIDCNEGERGRDKAYRISFAIKDSEDGDIDLFCGLLGLNKIGLNEADIDVLHMTDVEDAEHLLHQALDRAPRTRVRSTR